MTDHYIEVIFDLKKQDQNGNISTFDTYREKLFIQNVGTTLNITLSSSNGEFYLDTNEFTTVASEKFWVEYSIVRFRTDANAAPTLNANVDELQVDILENSNIENVIKNTVLLEGNDINLNDFLADMTVVDFFTAIRNTFNLCIDYDKLNNKTLNIEPYSDFFDFSNAIELKKYDTTTVNIKPVPLLNSKNIEFKYAEGSDVFNADYQDTTKETFGQFNYANETDFNKTKIEINVPFKPSPPMYDDSTRRIISSNYVRENNLKETSDGASSVLFYNLLTSPATYSIKHNAGNQVFIDYAYVGMWDNPHDPNQSLEWFYSKKQYVDIVNTSTANLFNNFWKSQIDEINDKNATMLTLDADLNENELSLLDFRNPVLLHNQYYFINKIEYSTSNEELAKLELIKINNVKKARSYIPNKTKKTIQSQAKILDDNLIRINPNINLNDLRQTVVNQRVVSSGESNYISKVAETGFVAGTNNRMLANNTLLLGDNSVSLLENQVVVGNGVTASATQSGIFLEGGSVIQIGGVNVSTFVTITRNDLVSNLIPNNLLISGALYKIDTQGTTFKDNGIFLQAISTNELSKVGYRKRLIPFTYGIGLDVNGNDWIGIWNNTLTVTIGQLSIWGGMVWQNLTGAIGTALNNFQLDTTNWILIQRDTFTNFEYREIETFVRYDYVNDFIESEIDKNNNKIGVSFDEFINVALIPLNPVEISDFGDDLILNIRENTARWGIYNNRCTTIENNNVRSIYNNRLINISDNTVFQDIVNNVSVSVTGFITNNICSIIGNNIFANIGNNIATSIFNNTLTGGSIQSNDCLGAIVGNVVTGNIFFNRNNGIINNQTNDIVGNQNRGTIDNNSGNFTIQNNFNLGGISSNTTANNIIFNRNNGSIDNNDVNINFIRFNQNNDAITQNTGVGGPWNIEYNQNNGTIGPASRTADVTDTIVNK